MCHQGHITRVSRVQIASDHALLPFGAGERKCVGDQFAVLEAAVTIIMLLRRFDFELAMDPVAPEKIDPNNPDRSVGVVGMKAAATIHTAEGLFMRVKERFPGKTDVPPRQVWPHRASSHLAGENDCHCELCAKLWPPRAQVPKVDPDEETNEPAANPSAGGCPAHAAAEPSAAEVPQ